MEKAKAIRVSGGTHSKLMHHKGLLEAKECRGVTIDEVILEILKRYKPT